MNDSIKWSKLKQARYFHKLTHNNFTRNDNINLEKSINQVMKSYAMNSFRMDMNVNKMGHSFSMTSSKLLKKRSFILDKDITKITVSSTKHRSSLNIGKSFQYNTVNEVDEGEIIPNKTINKILKINEEMNINYTQIKPKYEFRNKSNSKMYEMKSDKYLLEMIQNSHRKNQATNKNSLLKTQKKNYKSSLHSIGTFVGCGGRNSDLMKTQNQLFGSTFKICKGDQTSLNKKFVNFQKKQYISRNCTSVSKLSRMNPKERNNKYVKKSCDRNSYKKMKSTH